MPQNIVLAGHAKATDREGYLADGQVSGAVHEEIVASWHRSSWFGVGAEKAIELPFREGIERDSRLIRAARPVLDELERVLAGNDVSLLLADAGAYIVDRRVPSDGALRRRLDQFCGVLGACWSEEVAGTNGIGTAIENRRLTTVVGSDHFVDSLTFYACAGAPIVHPVTRRVEGVLDLSCSSRVASRFMGVIAAKAAREIEVGLLDQSHGRHQLLLERFLRVARNSRQPVIALAGEIVLTNHAAARVLDPADHAILREYSVDGMQDAEHRVALSDGRAGEVRCHAVRHGGEHVGAVLEVKPSSTESAGGAAARVATASPALPAALGALAGRSAAWRQMCLTAARRAAGTTPLLLAGGPGTGKRAVAEALLADHGPVELMDAVLANLRDPASWTSELRGRLARPGALIVQHVEALDADRRRILAAALDETAATRRCRVVATTVRERDDDRIDLGPLAVRFGDPVALPSLHERLEDIPELVAALAARHAATPPRFDPRVLQAFMRSDWPGNVRELETLVAQLVAERRGYDVRLEHLPVERSARLSGTRLRRIDRSQRDTILEALRRAHGNKTEAAAELGIARSTLYRKMVQFGLEDPSVPLPSAAGA